MLKTSFDFTAKFFYPPQRTVQIHNGLLDTRTKRTIAQDRFVVDKERFIEAQRRKSNTNIQLLASEKRQLEKHLVSLQNSVSSKLDERPLKVRGRSTSEVIFRNLRRTDSWEDSVNSYHSKSTVNLRDRNQNLLKLPKLDAFERRTSVRSDGDTTENTFSNSDMESGEEGNNIIRKNSMFRRKTVKYRRATLKRRTLPTLHIKSNQPLLPVVAVSPPEEDILFLVQ